MIVADTKTKRVAKDIPGETRPMTYEEYMAGPEEMRRYDILDGIKQYRLYGENQVASPTRTHQRIQGNIYIPFREWEIDAQTGEVIPPPCDVLITRNPKLRTRQPDMLFISRARLDKNLSPDTADPLFPAPELVVEILSPSDKPGVLAAKISDYQAVDVKELWVVRSGPKTVEVLILSPNAAPVSAGVYGVGQRAQSVIFAGLSADVSKVFAP